MFFAYGQRAAAPEERAAQALAARFGIPPRASTCRGSPISRAAALGARRSRARPAARHRGAPRRRGVAQAVWVPARNAVFVSVAAAFAETLGADCVLAGFNREEAATFADNSAGFVAAATAMLGFGTRNRVRVVSPTQDLDKAGIVAAARRLDFTAADFWSCYEDGAVPCGTCESCLRSRFTR
ncbi:MAG: 7-cyano-7-deazaguanine synthase [Planctomycetota bacterium]